MAFSAQRGVCENKTLTKICTVQFNSKFRFFNTIIHTVYTGMPRTRVNFSLHFAMSNRVEHLKFIFVYLYMYWCICVCVFVFVYFYLCYLYKAFFTAVKHWPGIPGKQVWTPPDKLSNFPIFL